MHKACSKTLGQRCSYLGALASMSITILNHSFSFLFFTIIISGAKITEIQYMLNMARLLL